MSTKEAQPGPVGTPQPHTHIAVYIHVRAVHARHHEGALSLSTSGSSTRMCGTTGSHGVSSADDVRDWDWRRMRPRRHHDAL
ncbi:hypothetical protein STCU_10155 [Strigomonas culicis]|uniref:Uncharacterized protein n=1 Tax=Strigomonas culicis TaxID=28005 RepID=S9V5K3_9TRYP|nr:hypothetical protein STCU_10155 [Strigomonas culicis]|eukprot:EPY18155.1 hypothetical protein STCU_10155 [Strigomonas culicis]